MRLRRAEMHAHGRVVAKAICGAAGAGRDENGAVLLHQKFCEVLWNYL